MLAKADAKLSRVVLEWTAGEIRYSLRLVTMLRPTAFIVAVGPVRQDPNHVVIRVATEAIEATDLAKWIGMTETFRTAAAEYLLSPSDDHDAEMLSNLGAQRQTENDRWESTAPSR